MGSDRRQMKAVQGQSTAAVRQAHRRCWTRSRAGGRSWSGASRRSMASRMMGPRGDWKGGFSPPHFSQQGGAGAGGSSQHVVIATCRLEVVKGRDLVARLRWRRQYFGGWRAAARTRPIGRLGWSLGSRGSLVDPRPGAFEGGSWKASPRESCAGRRRLAPRSGRSDSSPFKASVDGSVAREPVIAGC